jgi:hypothetical protein
MAMKYFADVDGQAIELNGMHGLANAAFAARFPNVKGRPYDSFSRYVGHGPAPSRELFPVTRVIDYKAAPSRHECDARCMHARGRTMTCECSCGGRNHGKGTAASVTRVVGNGRESPPPRPSLTKGFSLGTLDLEPEPGSPQQIRQGVPRAATQQWEIPGAAPISDGDLARRVAAAPLRPSAAQLPCDAGLFGDAAAQLDLIEFARIKS